MLFTSEYSMKMPIGQALLTAVIGILTVLLILAVIDILIILVSKTVRAVEKRFSGKAAQEPAPPQEEAKTGALPSVELIGVDEPTAAVLMAIVSAQSGIPLERLSFHSIRLLEDK